MTEEQLRQIAGQLRNPHGEGGLKMADVMHESNIAMTVAAIDAMDLQNNDRVLEIGHGNCAHLELVFAKAQSIQYNGLDISELMTDTAKSAHAKRVQEGSAGFTTYNGHILPYDTGSFDKIFTVNTIYFWAEPVSFLREIHRVMKPDGRLCIAFGQKAYMKNLPFTSFGFQLYDDRKIKTLIKNSGFHLYSTNTFNDHITSKTGEPIERIYTVISLEKSRDNPNTLYAPLWLGKKKRGLRRYFKKLDKLSLIENLHNFGNDFYFKHVHADNTGFGTGSFKRRKPHLDALFRQFEPLHQRLKSTGKAFQIWAIVYDYDSYNDRIYLHTDCGEDFPCQYNQLSKIRNLKNQELHDYLESLNGFTRYYGELYEMDDEIGPLLKRFCLLFRQDAGLSPVKTIRPEA